MSYKYEQDYWEEQSRKSREKYADIIELDRPKSAYPHMSIEDRAAQFAPFAALTGYHESVYETEDEYQKANETGGVSRADDMDTWIS